MVENRLDAVCLLVAAVVLVFDAVITFFFFTVADCDTAASCRAIHGAALLLAFALALATALDRLHVFEVLAEGVRRCWLTKLLALLRECICAPRRPARFLLVLPPAFSSSSSDDDATRSPPSE